MKQNFRCDNEMPTMWPNWNLHQNLDATEHSEFHSIKQSIKWNILCRFLGDNTSKRTQLMLVSTEANTVVERYRGMYVDRLMYFTHAKLTFSIPDLKLSLKWELL